MANLAFRPRPIDINKPLPIIRGELPEGEAAGYGVTRGVPDMPTGMESDEEEEAHIQEAIMAPALQAHKRDKGRRDEQGEQGELSEGGGPVPGAAAPVAEVEIPTPGCKVVAGYDEEKFPWRRPENYVLFTDATPEELDEAVEYDLDDEDAAFLQAHSGAAPAPRGGGGGGALQGVSEERMEYVLDRLEKVAGQHDGQLLPLDRVQALLAADPKLARLPPAALPALHAYWLRKRAANAGAPFIERFRRPPAFDDPSPYRAFRPREKEKQRMRKALARNDRAAYDKMLALRHEFERVRLLLEQVRRRELLKRAHVGLLHELWTLEAADARRRAQAGLAPRLASHGPGPRRRALATTRDDLSLSSGAGSVSDREEDEEEDVVMSEPVAPAVDSRADDGEWDDRDDTPDGGSGGSDGDEGVSLGPVSVSGPLQAGPAADQDEEAEADAEPAPACRGEELRLPGGPVFRGRARLGRGGRVLFERAPLAPVPERALRPAADYALRLLPADPTDDDLYEPPEPARRPGAWGPPAAHHSVPDLLRRCAAAAAPAVPPQQGAGPPPAHPPGARPEEAPRPRPYTRRPGLLARPQGSVH